MKKVPKINILCNLFVDMEYFTIDQQILNKIVLISFKLEKETYPNNIKNDPKDKIGHLVTSDKK